MYIKPIILLPFSNSPNTSQQSQFYQKHLFYYMPLLISDIKNNIRHWCITIYIHKQITQSITNLTITHSMKNHFKFWTKRVKLITGISIAVLFLLHKNISSVKSETPKPLQIENTDFKNLNAVTEAIDKSAELLMKMNKKNGQFVYRVNLNPKVKVKKKYNILRHSGSIYSLATYYQTHPSEELKDIILRASHYLKKETISPIANESNMLGVWSKPEINGSSNPPQVKLGGVGISLLALMCTEKVSSGFTPLEELQGMARFITYMQKEDGSFYSKYIPSLGGKQDKWTSLYYPGEAALGLMMLYEKDKSETWLKAAYKTIAFLANSRKGKVKVEADHWALLATAKILKAKRKGDYISEELLINHAIQICETMISAQLLDTNRPKYYGCFSSTGNTTPSSTRLEGMLAALSFLPKTHNVTKRIESSVEKGISFLLNAQISEGKYTGGFQRAVGKQVGDSKKIKSFNKRVTEIRIDYVQHALSAFMQYKEMYE